MSGSPAVGRQEHRDGAVERVAQSYARVAAKDQQALDKEERRLASRERILDAFVEVVGRVGYSPARVTEICQMAGVSNRTFYATFLDKADCFVAAFDAKAWMLTERAKEAYDAAGGIWEDQVRAGLEVITSYLAANPCYARFCTVEATRLGPAATARMSTVLQSCGRLFKSEASRQLPPPLQGGPLGSLLSGAITLPIFNYVENGKIDQLPELVSTLVYYVTLVVLGPERAVRQLDAGG